MKPIATLAFDIRVLSAGMHLSESEVRQYFTDGRRVSFILERRISNEVIKGKLALTEGAAYDLIDEQGGKWEVRSLTRQGVYFCPSYMVGSGRSFDEFGFLEKLDEIEGYLISHVDEFPDVPVWQIPKEVVRQWYQQGQLGSSTKISAVRAIALITGHK